MAVNRLDRVNEVLKRELSELVRRELTFQSKLVTIMEVDITPDLKHAHVYVGVIGSEEEQFAAIGQLHGARKKLQHEIGRRVTMKFTPQFHFKLDTTGVRGDHILNLINQLGLPEEPPEPQFKIVKPDEPGAPRTDA